MADELVEGHGIEHGSMVNAGPFPADFRDLYQLLSAGVHPSELVAAIECYGIQAPDQFGLKLHLAESESGQEALELLRQQLDCPPGHTIEGIETYGWSGTLLAMLNGSSASPEINDPTPQKVAGTERRLNSALEALYLFENLVLGKLDPAVRIEGITRRSDVVRLLGQFNGRVDSCSESTIFHLLRDAHQRCHIERVEQSDMTAALTEPF